MATESKTGKPVLKKDAAKPVQKKKGKGAKASFAAVGRFFRDVVSELKKVTWPTRKEFVSYGIAVVVFVTVFSIVILAMDYTIGNGVSQLLGAIGG